MTPRAEDPRRGYLRHDEAAWYLGISPRTLREWKRARKVPFAKMSHRVSLYRISDLDRAIDRLMVKEVGHHE